MNESQSHGQPTPAFIMSEDGEKTCQICYSKVHPKRQPLASIPCGHDEICGLCHLRIRYLHEDKNCPICKTPNEQVVVGGDKPFEEYNIWGDDLGSDFVYHDLSGMFFPKDYFHSSVRKLFRYDCHVRDCSNRKFESLRSLQDHLRKEHRLGLCQLCVDHKRDFVDRLPRYSPTGLVKHADSKQGHPVCEFCHPLRFYDLTALHSHLSKEHYKCHLCEQHLDLPNQFFRDYASLHRHFEQYHFACGDPQCLSARFVAFATELDLRHHERQVHGAPSTGSTKIQLQFRTKRRTATEQDEDNNNSFDNNAFVPPSLPSSGDNRLHPQHEQRTEELRREAAMLRDQQDDAESFPTLAEQGDQQETSRLTIGWSNDSLQRVGRTKTSVGQVTEDAFPSLPASRSRSSSTRLTTLRPQKQSAPQSSGWQNGTTRNAPTSMAPAARSSQAITNAANLTSSNFPSLAAPASSGGGLWGSAAATRPKGRSQTAASLKPVDLSTDNFPSLAPSNQRSSAPKYTAAQSLAKKLHSSSTNSNNYPSLTAQLRKPPPGLAQQPAAQQIPNAGSVASFPALPAVADAADLGKMKILLGGTIYKALKSYTKQYSQQELTAQSYIDYAASVFEGGYSDPNFWKFVPALVESCPTVDPALANSYLQELRKLRNGAINAEAWNIKTKQSDNVQVKRPTKKKGKQTKELQSMAFGR